MTKKTLDNLREDVREKLQELARSSNSTLMQATNDYMKTLYVHMSTGPVVLAVNMKSKETIEKSIWSFPDECFTQFHAREQVFDAINKERKYQDEKWGADKPQSLPGFLLIMQSELNEAVEGWMKNSTGRHATLNEIVQVAATAVACLEKYGVEGSAESTDDIPWKR